MLKKSISVLLAFLFVVGIFTIVPFTISAATSGTTGDCTWTLDGTVLTISGNGEMDDYDLYISPWESERWYITEVIIEDGVTRIGSHAFRNINLTDVDIPDSVQIIGSFAFENCSLFNVSIPDSVVFIEPGAFKNCNSLSSVSIPDSVRIIGGGTFSGCTNLTSVDIPNSVVSINYESFSGCIGLTSVDIPDSVKYINSGAFSGCTGLTSVDIPDSVVSIGAGAFADCSSLTSVNIPDSVFYLGYRSFENTAWYNSQPAGLVYVGKVAYKLKGSFCPTDIIIKNGTLGIASGAFEFCWNLTNVLIPDSVKYIGTTAFWGTAWFDRHPKGLVYAGKVVCGFDGSAPYPETVKIADGTVGIAGSAFDGCGDIVDITIPETVILNSN